MCLKLIFIFYIISFVFSSYFNAKLEINSPQISSPFQFKNEMQKFLEIEARDELKVIFLKPK